MTTTTTSNYEIDLHLEATELRLGLPGLNDKQSSPSISRGVKRPSPEMETKNNSSNSSSEQKQQQPKIVSQLQDHPTPTKTQVVGWPPVRSYRKNCMEKENKKKENIISVGENVEPSGNSLVKVSMDGAPYLRKIDLKFYQGYPELVKALETMFNCTIGCCYDESDQYATTYEDKDGDWMLAGDVPWEMFITSCKRMRIMKGSQTKGFKSDL